MNKIWDSLWTYVFPVLSVILWIITIRLFFRMNAPYMTNSVEAERVMNAMRWHPACFVGAIIATATGYVTSELRKYFDEKIKGLANK